MQSITYDAKCKNMNLGQNSMTNSFHATTLVFFFTPRKEKTSTAGIYLFKVNNRNTRTIYEICSKLTIKTPQWSQWRHSGAFIVNFKHILHIALLFLLLTLNKWMPAGSDMKWMKIPVPQLLQTNNVSFPHFTEGMPTKKVAHVLLKYLSDISLT